MGVKVKSYLKAVAAIAAVISTISPVQAQIVMSCEINFSGRIGIDKYGSLNIDFVDAGIVNLCSMSADERGVTKEGCAAWYSALLSLKLAKGRAVFYFDSTHPGNANLVTCANLGDWSAHTPYFLQSM